MKSKSNEKGDNDDKNEMMQKLKTMKKELARKQRKLEKARRAAQVKAHVRLKLQEQAAQVSSDVSTCVSTGSCLENTFSAKHKTTQTHFAKNENNNSGVIKSLSPHHIYPSTEFRQTKHCVQAQNEALGPESMEKKSKCTQPVPKKTKGQMDMECVAKQKDTAIRKVMNCDADVNQEVSQPGSENICVLQKTRVACGEAAVSNGLNEIEVASMLPNKRLSNSGQITQRQLSIDQKNKGAGSLDFRESPVKTSEDDETHKSLSSSRLGSVSSVNYTSSEQNHLKERKQKFGGSVEILENESFRIKSKKHGQRCCKSEDLKMEHDTSINVVPSDSAVISKDQTPRGDTGMFIQPQRSVDRKETVTSSESDEDIIAASQTSTSTFTPRLHFPTKKNLKADKTDFNLLSLTSLTCSGNISEKEKPVQFVNRNDSVTDSEFLHILGVSDVDAKSEVVNVMGDENVFTLPEIKKQRKPCDIFNVSKTSQDMRLNSHAMLPTASKQEPCKSTCSSVSHAHATLKTKESSISAADEAHGNKIMSNSCVSNHAKNSPAESHKGVESKSEAGGLITCIPDTEQMDTQFSQFTELDAIPFNHFELTEDFLSENSQQKGNPELGCFGRRSLVKRCSPRFSSLNLATASLSSLSSTSSQCSSEKERLLKLAGVKSRRKKSLSQQKLTAAISSIFQFLVDEAKKPESQADFDLPPSFLSLKNKKIKEEGMATPTPMHEVMSSRDEEQANFKFFETEEEPVRLTAPVQMQLVTQNSTTAESDLTRQKFDCRGIISQPVSEAPDENDLVMDCNDATNNLCSSNRIERDTPANVIENPASLCSQNVDMKKESTPSSSVLKAANRSSGGTKFFSADQRVCEGDVSFIQNSFCSTPSRKFRRFSRGMKLGRKLFTSNRVDTNITSNRVDTNITSNRVDTNARETTSTSNRSPEITEHQVKNSQLTKSNGSPNLLLGTRNIAQESETVSRIPTGKEINFSENASQTPRSPSWSSRTLLDAHTSVHSTTECEKKAVEKSKQAICMAPSPILGHNQLGIVSTPDVTHPEMITDMLSPSISSSASARKEFSFASTPKLPRNRRSGSSLIRVLALGQESQKGGESVLQESHVEGEKQTFFSSKEEESLRGNNNTDPLLEETIDECLAVSVTGSPSSQPESKGESTSSVHEQRRDVQQDKEHSALNISPCKSPLSNYLEDTVVTLKHSLCNTIPSESVTYVSPWKVVPRTPTTPVQVFEQRLAGRSQLQSPVFTPNKRKFRSKALRLQPGQECLQMKKGVLKFAGCFQACVQDAVVSLLSGQHFLEDQKPQSFIVSVQATSLTLWVQEEGGGWVTELDWRLAAHVHILSSCLLPRPDKVAVLASGYEGKQLFVTVFVYDWTTEHAHRFNLPVPPFEEAEHGCPSRAILCPESDCQLLLGLTNDRHHVVHKFSFLESVTDIGDAYELGSQRGRLEDLVMVKGQRFASVSLSADQRITVWNTKLGIVLTTVQCLHGLPCLTGLVKAASCKGLLLLTVVWRVDGSDCGGVVAVNPCSGATRRLSAYSIPNNGWKGVEEAKMMDGIFMATSDRGSFSVWESKSGQLLAHRPSNITTCATLTADHHALVLGEIHGCLHIYHIQA